MNFDNLNIWGWVLIIMTILNLWVLPFMWGKNRGVYGWSTLISNIIGIVILLLALDVLSLRIGF